MEPGQVTAPAMSNSLWSELPKPLVRRLLVIWAVAFVGSGSFLVVALLSLRAEALRAGEGYAQSLARLASEQTSRSFQTVGQALALAEADLAQLAEAQGLTEDSARTALSAQLRYLPYVRALWFMDADGVIRYDTDFGNIGVSLRDRDYVQAHLHGRHDVYVGMPYVGPPVRSRSLGTWLVSVSRAARQPDGTLHGVLAAAIEPPYFDKLWHSVELGPDGTVGLFSREGALLLRSPWIDDAVGRSFAQFWPFSSGLTSSHGSAVITSQLDGRKRLLSYRTLDEFPSLVLIVGVDHRLILRSWQRFAAVSVAIWVVAMALLTLLLALWARDARRRYEGEQRSARARRLEAIGTLAGGVAHDFNNVIAAVLGNTKIARQQVAGDSAAHETLRRIELSGLRARALVQQILAFSRGEPEVRAQIDLRPLIEETIGLLRATLPSRIRLSTRLGSQPVVITADPSQIQQVVMNLCTNAWQAIGAAAGSVEVGLDVSAPGARAAVPDLPQLAGAHAHIWVRDTGSGMPPEDLERIFEPFFTTKRKSNGTGLGLSVVHGLVTAHGGTVVVRSRVGAGSTFHVFLPMADAASAAQAPASGLEDEPAVDGQGLKVLCVDDDEVILVMLEGILTAQHFEVIAVRSPEEALERLPALAPGLAAVVTDFDMPSSSGVELAQQVRALAPGLPVVLMSGYINDEIETAARNAGIVELVHKEGAYTELAGVIVRAHRAAMDRGPPA
jgi:signal transduction histidine kinase/CheY-like chemotaxis protein